MPAILLAVMTWVMIVEQARAAAGGRGIVTES
jgi:hypothetical protein